MASYKIKSGDTVSQIAKRMGVRVQDIVSANPDLGNVNKIRVGQSLKIPAAKTGKNKGSQGPYGRTSKVEMSLMGKDGEAYTRGVRAKMKAGAETTPTPKKAKATKDAKSGRSAMLAKAKAKKAAELAKKKKAANNKKMALPKTLPKSKPKKTAAAAKPKKELTAVQKKSRAFFSKLGKELMRKGPAKSRKT